MLKRQTDGINIIILLIIIIIQRNPSQYSLHIFCGDDTAAKEIRVCSVVFSYPLFVCSDILWPDLKLNESQEPINNKLQAKRANLDV
jgi:hypothetical protein